MPAVSSWVSKTRASPAGPRHYTCTTPATVARKPAATIRTVRQDHPSTLAHLIPAGPARYSGGVLGSPWADSLSSPPGCLRPQRLSAPARSQASWNQRPINWPP